MGRSGALDGRDDAGVPDEPDVERPERPADPEVLQSRLLDVLSSEAFQQAACRLAGVAAQSESSPLSCEDRVQLCLDAVGGFDASASTESFALPEQVLQLDDCDVTLAQADACLADVVELVVTLSEDVSCAMDAGIGSVELGPEALVAAPSCLPVVLSCPALLELLATTMPP